MKVEVYGASDDLIEVEGDISEEFNVVSLATDPEGALLAFADGTVIRVSYTDSGVWRINPVYIGAAAQDLTQAPEGDEDNYSDRLVLQGPNLNWVVLGTEIAMLANG